KLPVRIADNIARNDGYQDRDSIPLFGLDRENPAAADGALIESASFGRGAARSRLASIRSGSNETVNLLAIACRESLYPGEHSKELGGALKSYTGDPLWSALARHLARRSTKADRELLVDLAQHPEKREPPLQWGLRHIVRGDV